MARLLVLQHSTVGRPGRLGLTLRDHGFLLDIQRLDLADDPSAVDLDGAKGLVILGGPQSPTDSSAWMRHEIELIRRAHEAELTVIGVCLGAQLIAVALGGSVGKMPQPEVGCTEVDVTVPGQTDTIMAGIPWRTHWFNSHEYEVTGLPSGSVHLMQSAACRYHAFRVGVRTFAFQSHIEADRAIIDGIYSTEHELFKQAGIQGESLAKAAAAHYPRFAEVADRLCVNLASYAFPFSSLLGA